MREKDSRDFHRQRGSEAAARSFAETLSAALPGEHRVTVKGINPMTGTAASLHAEAAPESDASLIQTALDYVQGGAGLAMGFAAGTEPSAFVPDPHVQRTRGGAMIVHLQQQYRGIPIFEMNRAVHFSPDRKVRGVVGDNTQVSQEIDTRPKIDAAAAVRVAAEYLSATDDGPQLDHWGQKNVADKLLVPADYQPQAIASFPSPELAATFEKGPFGDEVQASLSLFDQGEAMRLVWKVIATMPGGGGQYLLLVAADRADAASLKPDDLVLYCRDLMASAFQGNVFRRNPGAGDRELIDFPQPAARYPLSHGVLPAPFPDTWWVTKDQTIGNCTVAVQGNGTLSFTGAANGGSVLFDANPPNGPDQQLINIFYFCNYMHDFYYMLGFDEEAGNFQLVDFTGKGAGGDPVTARAFPQPVNGTANMVTPVDGKSPTMNMGLVASTGRHTAFDSDVVFHEYTHGLSNRLVGGRVNDRALVEPQSQGMGEGWSDYFALTVQNYDQPNEKTVLGDWVVNQPAGIRLHPYDSNYPGTFGDLGSPPYDRDVHAIGEIWCAALMQMNRNLAAALGSPTQGYELAWQIVVDGMKLSPANPSFLQARDAILTALSDLHRPGQLTDDQFTACRRAAWSAFARFGMGTLASCSAASLVDVVGDSTLPADL
jgi:extracellular elastinolytic metalloproteinase